MTPLQNALKKVVPPEVRTISRVLNEAGFSSWLVGGSVRDILLALSKGQEPQGQGDWDFATNAHPRDVSKLFRQVIPTGIQHGTVTIVLSKQHFEVTSLRGELGHSDGRRPDEVFFVQELKEDLARRDFTINAMAYNLEDDTFHDPFSGEADLHAGLIRAVGEPAKRFAEDGLRVLRCARFCAALNMNIEEKTEKAILPSLSSFEKVAQERVRDEWFKALRSQNPSRFLHVIKNCGLLNITAADLWADSNPSSFLTATRKIDHAQADPLFRLALFIALNQFCDDSPHERAACAAKKLGRHLRLSRAELGRLILLTSHASPEKQLTESPSGLTIRKWLQKVGREQVKDVLDFQRAARLTNDEKLHAIHALILHELEQASALSLRELKISGRDLIEKVGVPKGRRLGELLGLLLDEVLQDPQLNQEHLLLARAHALQESSSR